MNPVFRNWCKRIWSKGYALKGNRDLTRTTEYDHPETLRDITERKKTELALKESEERFRSVFEHAAVGVALLNPHTGNFVKINRKYCEIIGYDSEEIIGKHFREITHPDDVEVDQNSAASVLAGEAPSFTREKRYIRRDGDIAWVNLTVSAMWSKGEEPSLFIAIVEEITNRKRLEERGAVRLRLSELARNSSIDDLAQTGLSEITRLTNSRIGHLHLTAADQENIVLHMPSPGVCLAETPVSHALWKECFLAQNPQLQNRSPGRHQQRDAGDPPDAPRSITVRIFQDSATGALLSVHDKPTEYLDHDVQTLQETGSLLMDLVARKRAEEMQQNTIQLLRLCNDAQTSAELIPRLCDFFKQLTGCEMVEARLPLHRKMGVCHEPTQTYGSFIFLPLQFNGENYGVLEFGDGRSGYLNAGKMALLENLVSYGSIALAKLLADESLVKTERALRTAKQIAKLGSYSFDILRDCWTSSAILNGIFGIGPDMERTMATWANLVHPSQHQEMIEYTAALFAHKRQRFDKEYLIVRPSDGKEIWVHGLGEIEYDENDLPLRLFGTIQDITERKRAQETIYRFTQRLLKVEEELRKKIAKELHDNIGQELTALSLNLSFINKFLGDRHGTDIQEVVQECNGFILKVNRSVRQIMTELRPPQLDDYGLTAAITWYAALFAERTNIGVKVSGFGFPRLPEEREIALFRIFQEYLAGVPRKAGITRLDVRLKKESDEILLTMDSDGAGMPADSSHMTAEDNWDIMIMRERTELLGGTFKLNATPSGGTVVTIRIPEEQS